LGQGEKSDDITEFQAVLHAELIGRNLLQVRFNLRCALLLESIFVVLRHWLLGQTFSAG
jgi:hypothetical protein